MRFLWNSFIQQSGLMPSSTKTGFDVGDLKRETRARWFEFIGNDETLVIDAGEIVPVEWFIIDVGNLTPGSTVILEGNGTDDWSSPAFSTTLDFQKTAFMKEFDQQFFRWWRLRVAEPTVTNIRLGYVSYGFNHLQLPPLDQGVSLFYETTNEANFSLSGQVRGSVGYEYLRTSFSFSRITEQPYSIRGVEISTRKDMLEFWSRMRNTTPFWCILWENNIDDYPPLLCVMEDNLINPVKVLGKAEYNISFTIREVI